ncbi:PAS domain S-box protein [bacterium]|nr:PAS domain S-box protein [bacterium]
MSTGGAKKDEATELSPLRRAAIHRAAAYRMAWNVAGGLAATYAVTAPLPLLRAGLPRGGVLFAVTLVAMCAMLWLRRAQARRRLPHRRAHLALGLALAVLVVRVLLGWALIGDDSQIGFLALVILAVGYLCVSAAWAYPLIAAVDLGWLAGHVLSGSPWVNEYLPIFLVATPVALFIHRANDEARLRAEQRRARDRRQKAQLRAATARASESERRFRGIFERIQDVYLRVDTSGRIEMISPSVTRFGYQPHELLGTNAAALFAPTDVERGRALIDSRDPLGDVEMRWRRRDGTELTVSISGSTLRDGSGAVIGFEAILRDISQRKRLEEERREQQAELAHVLRLSSMGEMAAEMAHELTQPLAAMVNYASACARYVRSGRDERAKLLQGLELIAAQGLRAGEIVRRIRSYVAKRPPQREIVDVAALVAQAAHTVAAESARARLPIAIAAPRGEWFASVDAIQIEQVIVNLLLNALEAVTAAADGDRITVSIGADAAGQLEVAVADPGCGLGALAPRIFDPFFSTKPAGLGMGLAISRSIIESHGGLLWATPNPERGTTFRFTLPRAAAVPAAREAAATVH